MADNKKPSDSDWLQRLDDPSQREEAAREIYNKYSQQLLNLVQRQLNELLMRRAEPQDIMQSVFKSFFSRKFQLRDADTLFPLLAEMCVCKTNDAARRHTAQKRSVASETELADGSIESQRRPSDVGPRVRIKKGQEISDASGTPDHEREDSSISLGALQNMARGATPEQALVAIELFERLPPELQQILSMRLEGYCDEEISEELRCTRRTIVRRMNLIRQHFRSANADTNAEQRKPE